MFKIRQFAKLILTEEIGILNLDLSFVLIFNSLCPRPFSFVSFKIGGQLGLVECTFFSEFSYARTNYIQNFPEIIKPTKKVESLVEAASTKNAALVF